MNWSEPAHVVAMMVASVIVAWLLLETTFKAIDLIDRDRQMR
jgi:hypothetical protein